MSVALRPHALLPIRRDQRVEAALKVECTLCHGLGLSQVPVARGGDDVHVGVALVGGGQLEVGVEGGEESAERGLPGLGGAAGRGGAGRCR